MPDTAAMLTRARTTQKRVVLVTRRAASLSIWTFTRTREKSLSKVMSVTRPMSTSLYLTLVFPASRLSADLK
jgi:hypothetical protein